MVNRFQKFAKLYRSMPTMAFAQHRPSPHIQRRKQRGRPIPDIIMGSPLHLSGPHRQNRLFPIQSLNLRFLIDTQNQGSIRRVQVEPHNIPNLLNKKRILGQLESFRTMRLQSKSSPDSAHRALAHSTLLCHSPGAPVRRVGGGGFERFGDHSFDIGIRDGTRSARARLIEKAVQTSVYKTRPPFADGGPSDLEGSSHVLVLLALSTHKNDARTERQCLSCFSPTGPSFQGFSLVWRKMERRNGTADSHDQSFFPSSIHQRELLFQRIINS